MMPDGVSGVFEWKTVVMVGRCPRRKKCPANLIAVSLLT
jgi:hypothetical protein